jgi:hypothetical protein
MKYNIIDLELSMASVETTNKKWLDEIHLTQDSGVIKRIYRFGEEDITPQKG